MTPKITLLGKYIYAQQAVISLQFYAFLKVQVLRLHSRFHTSKSHIKMVENHPEIVPLEPLHGCSTSDNQMAENQTINPSASYN